MIVRLTALACCLIGAAMTGCAYDGPDAPPPRGQTYPLAEVRARLSRVQRGMSMDHVRRVLGEPALREGSAEGNMRWYYLPPRRGLQLPQKLEVLFFGNEMVRHRFKNTYASDYAWDANRRSF